MKVKREAVTDVMNECASPSSPTPPPQSEIVFFERISFISVLEATTIMEEGRSSSEKMVDVGCSMPVVSYLSFALIAVNTVVNAVNLAVANNNDQNDNNNLNANANGRRRRRGRRTQSNRWKTRKAG